MKRTGLYLIVTALLAGTAAAVVTGLWMNPSKTHTYVYEKDGSAATVQQVNLPASEYPDLTFAAEKCVKSVVHVKVTKRGQSIGGNDFSLFDFFFGYGQPNMPPREQVGTGSGVILTSDGYIVTNNHVIKGADKVEVTLENKRTFDAKIIGADGMTDLALLKIDATELPALGFGDAEALRLGEWVLAIGNPYNLNNTITAGIVSAKARSMAAYEDDMYNRGEVKIESFIQTDAAVNPGNSGGALVNTKGELVGINTAIASRTGSYAGYSFAVPATIVKKVVKDMMEHGGVVQRALLGITMQDMTEEIAKEKGISSLQGVYIYEIVPGGAADKAGMKSGDVLLAINGKPVNKMTEVQEQISKYSPGDKVEVEISRGGKSFTEQATLQSREDSANGDIMTDTGGVSNFLGASLRVADARLCGKLRIRSGVEVVAVSEGAMKRAGVRKGFVITHVDRNAVSSVADLAMAIQHSQRGALIEGKYPDGSTYYYALNK